jgi:formylglycine-generating enzyme required for sulfatase activity
LSPSPKDTGKQRIEAADFRPPEARAVRAGGVRGGWIAAAVVVPVLALFGFALWFVLTAEAVRIEIEPAAAELSVRGGLSVPVGERYLMRPGDYRVHAEAAGYKPLEAPLRLRAGGERRFAYTLEPLPGRLDIVSEPAGADVRVDGEHVGTTPIEGLTLAPGTYQLRLQKPRHVVAQKRVTVEGRGIRQRVSISLRPAWAPVEITSEPAGATVSVDGEARGQTPVTLELGAGERELALSLEGYRSATRRITVEADEPMEVGPIALERAPAELRVESDPTGASVRVGEAFAGRTPLTLELPPGRSQRIVLSKAGHESLSRELKLASGERERLYAELTPRLGEVRVAAEPADAELLVDGEPRGPASQTLELLAVEHEIVIRKPGYAPFETTVTPRPGEPQRLDVALLTEEEARYAELPERVRNPVGQPMRLIRPGRFTMGAPRREQGRRANETLREVELTRAFYIATREVSNAELRAFRPGHSSGRIQRETLDNDRQPVVNISWADAVAFCNWLSAQEGREPAYDSQGKLVAPYAGGYRLPSEAEWAYAARFAGGRNQKFPWGDAMPPRGEAGNFADVSAAVLLEETLSDYDDGYPATAPVASFAPNDLGLFDMGGNVSEWMTDVYAGNVQVVTRRQVDPIGEGSGNSRAVRGASWRSASITELRLSWRGHSSSAADDIGFRVVRSAVP